MALQGKNNKALLLRDDMEEAAFIRQKCNSLALRGHYAECAKLIEDNIARIYAAERWPESFFNVLKTYQRCYPALNKNSPVEKHVRDMLKKSGVPYVFAQFLENEPPVKWSSEFFKNQALEARKYKKYETALAWCDLAIKLEPASTNLYLLKGWVCEDMEDYETAITMLRHSLELNESNVKASQAIARIYSKTNLNKALEFLDESIKAHPGDASLYGEKAAVLIKLEKKDEAEKCYDKAIELDSYSCEYVCGKGELLLEEGNLSGAVTMFKRAIALNPKHVPSLLKLASLYETKAPIQALEFLTTVVSIEPDNLGAALGRANMLKNTRDIPNAAKQYKEVLDMDENNEEALAGLAVCLTGDDDRAALGYYKRLVEMSPGKAEYHMGKAKVHELLNNAAESIAEYKIVLSLNKKDHRAHAGVGRLTASDDPTQAIACYDKAIALDPKNAEYHAKKAELLLSVGRGAEAISSLNTACMCDPGNAVLHVDLALLLQKAGSKASAIQNYREALNLSPTLELAHKGLAELFMYSEPDRAILHINSAIGLDVSSHEPYYIKSRILVQLNGNKKALESLEKHLAGTIGKNFYEETVEIIGGGCLRVALVHIDNAIELSGRNTTYLCYRASILFDMGQKPKALEQYQALLKKDPNSHEALYGVGCILADKRDPKCLEYLEKAITLSPETAKYYARKASWLARDSAKYSESVACYDSAIRLDLYDYIPPLERAKLLESRGDILPAVAGYRRTLLINPNCFEATVRLAKLLVWRRPASAEHYINHCAFLDPDNYELYILKALILYAQNKTEEAGAQCSQAITKAAGGSKVYVELAEALGDKFPEIALEYAIMAAEKDTRNNDSQLLCGNLYLALERFDEAMNCFRSAIDQGAGGEAQEKLAELMYKTGDPAVVESIDKLPKTPGGFMLKARILDELSDPPATDDAAELLAKAVKKYPDNLQLGELYVEILKKKRSIIKQAMEKNRLNALRRRLKKEEDEIIHVDEITFDSEQDEPEV